MDYQIIGGPLVTTTIYLENKSFFNVISYTLAFN